MAVRKQRSKQFLSNPLAAFNIIFTLVFHYLLTHVTAAAFALMDSDRDDIMEKKPTHRQEIKERKRLRYKGAQCFEDPEHQPQGSGMADLFLKASQVVNVLWTVLASPGALTESIFSVPGAFWPEGHGRHQLLERLVDDILKTLCGLKWRILYRKEAPPLQCLHLQSPDFDPAQRQLHSSWPPNPAVWTHFGAVPSKLSCRRSMIPKSKLPDFRGMCTHLQQI